MSETSDSVEHVSAVAFDATLERLISAIAHAGMTLFGRVDHQAGARKVGLDMPPATVLTYGNPRGGTPAMLASPLAALDLPLRVLVYERADGRAAIAFHPIRSLLGRAGVPDDLAGRLEPAQKLLVDAVVAP